MIRFARLIVGRDAKGTAWRGLLRSWFARLIVGRDAKATPIHRFRRPRFAWLIVGRDAKALPRPCPRGGEVCPAHCWKGCKSNDLRQGHQKGFARLIVGRDAKVPLSSPLNGGGLPSSLLEGVQKSISNFPTPQVGLPGSFSITKELKHE